jgi:hypothetical protein
MYHDSFLIKLGDAKGCEQTREQLADRKNALLLKVQAKEGIARKSKDQNKAD